MPVYNSQDYVGHAIESILEQDFDDYELLLIDDGSTDGSGAVCDHYAASNPHIQVFHKENGGMCSARNYGISKSKGQYIGFCDNDDEFLPGLLRDNCAIASDEAPDVVRFGRRLIMKGTSSEHDLVSDLCPIERALYRGDEIFLNYSETRKSVAVWNALYRRDLLLEHSIRFDERLRHGVEDAIFNLDVLQVAQSVACNPKIYYTWTRRVGHSSSFDIAPDFILGTRIAVQKDYRLMVNRKVMKYHPEVFASVIVRYLMDPLEAILLADSMSLKSTLPLLKQLQQIFSPYREDVLSCPLPASRRLFFASVTAGKFRLAYTAMVLSRAYLRLSDN